MKGSHRTNGGGNGTQKPSPKPAEIVSAWLAIYAEMYRREMSPELVNAYHHALEDLQLSPQLERALERAMAQSKFLPTVAEIRAAYEHECEKSFAFGRDHGHRPVPAQDSETGTPVTAWVYPADPKQELHYRADDCPEGRVFRSLLRAKGKTTYPPYRPCTSRNKLHAFTHPGKGGVCTRCNFTIPF